MAREFKSSFVAGEMLVQAGCTKKTSEHLEIRFEHHFREQPSVVVTPFWEHQHGEVGHAETIESIAADSFFLTSGNAAANYFVTWIAVGRVDR